MSLTFVFNVTHHILSLQTADPDALTTAHHYTTVQPRTRTMMSMFNMTCSQRIASLSLSPRFLGLNCVLGLLDLLVIVGNFLVTFSVLRFRALHTPANYFIASLALSDLLIGVMILPFSIAQETLGFWIFGSVWCQLWMALDIWMCTASIYNLVAISLDRYLAVSRPMKYKMKWARHIYRSFIPTVWVLSFMICSPPLLRNLFSSNENGTGVTPGDFGISVGLNVTFQRDWLLLHLPDIVCGPCIPMNNSPSYIMFSGLCSFFIPTAFLTILNSFIYSKAKRATRAISTGVMQNGSLGRGSKFSSVSGYCSQADLSGLRIHRGRSSLVTAPKTHAEAFRPRLSTPDGLKMVRPRRRKSSELIEIMRDVGKETVQYISTNLEVNIEEAELHSNEFTSSGMKQRSSKLSLPHNAVLNCSLPGTPRCSPRKTASHSKQLGSSEFSREQTLSLELEDERDLYLTQQNGYLFTASTGSLLSKDVEPNGPVAQIAKKLSKTATGPMTSLNYGIWSRFRRMAKNRFSRRHQPVHEESVEVFRKMGMVSPGRLSVNRFYSRITKAAITSKEKVLRSEAKATVTVTIVVGCFIVCWLPFSTIYLLEALEVCSLRDGCLSSLLFSVSFWLGYFNSALNPIIYALFSRELRRAFATTLMCRGQFNKVKSSPRSLVGSVQTKLSQAKNHTGQL